MPAELQLEVVTPARTVLKDRVESIIAPAQDGLVGVLANHTPLVTGLGIGVLQFGEKNGDKKLLSIANGFMEVGDNIVTILADAAELPEEIDVERARAAKERAEERLRSSEENVDYARAQAAFHRAMSRLQVAQGR